MPNTKPLPLNPEFQTDVHLTLSLPFISLPSRPQPQPQPLNLILLSAAETISAF